MKNKTSITHLIRLCLYALLCAVYFNAKSQNIAIERNYLPDTINVPDREIECHNIENSITFYQTGAKFNYDSAQIIITGDTMKVIRNIMKYKDLRDKQYYTLQDLVKNIDNKKYNYYLKKYIAVRDSVIK